MQPENIRELVIEALLSELRPEKPTKKWKKKINVPTGLSALTYLKEQNPLLALDPEIQEMVIEYSTCSAIGYRNRAASILHKIGHPLGILHLTYNALRVHPTAGYDQTIISGWSDVTILRLADQLTEPCIDLLLTDIEAPPHWFHADVLAKAPPSLVVPKLLKLLSTGRDFAVLQAAYALQMQGCPEGRQPLWDAITTGDVRALEMAIVAFSHNPDDKNTEFLRAVAKGSHPILAKIPNYLYFAEKYSDQEKLNYQGWAKQRLAVLDQQIPFVELCKAHYWRSYEREISTAGLPRRQAIECFSLYPDHFDCARHSQDFIEEFSTELDRQQMAEKQKQAMEGLLDSLSKEYWFDFAYTNFMRWQKQPARFPLTSLTTLNKSKNLPDFYAEREDYIFAATDWIMNPKEYRSGLVSKTRWGW